MKRLANNSIIQVLLFLIAVHVSDLYSHTSKEISMKNQKDEITIYSPGTELESDKSVFARSYDCTDNDNSNSQLKFRAIVRNGNISL